MNNQSILLKTIYWILSIPAFILAILAFGMSIMGLGMISFVPGVISLAVALMLYLLYKNKKKFSLGIAAIALISIVFAGLRTIIFAPKIADEAELVESSALSEDELTDDLSEAFGDLDFGDESVTNEKPIQAADKIYATHCARCHQPDGMGIPGKYPPLAQADYLENRLASISAVIIGMSGENVINNQVYTAEMPKADLNDREIVAVINYIFSNWGNQIQATNLAEVKKIKSVSK
ncbi:MAG: cytochrome c [Bacteroidales bacterium]|nr:cytochrome c [Bacteroidales bacterium]